MQTAVGVFGGGSYSDGINAPPLMVANAGHSDRPAITSLNCPPFLAVELCREHLVCLVTSVIKEKRKYRKRTVLSPLYLLATELKEPKTPVIHML